MLQRDELNELVDELKKLRDAELVLLRGHMLVERQLTAAVAVRLKIQDDEVPRLGFAALAELAVQEPAERKQVLWLNGLRNVAAHEYHGLDSKQFRDLVSCFGLPWPSGSLERCLVMHMIVQHVFWVAWRQTL